MTFFRPELELLLCCARAGMDAGRAAKAESLLKERLDWDYLLAVAGEHGMKPLLFNGLAAIGPDAVPEERIEELRGHFRANKLRNLFLSGELLKVLDAFAEHGVAVVPYKGPALAADAYGNLALREFGDLDILVRKGDIMRAKEPLASLGYVQQDLLTPAQEAAYLHADCEYHFASGGADGHMVELHWEIATRNFSFPFNDDSLWKRLHNVPFGGRAVPSFSPENSLMVVCTHGCADFWRQLKSVCDVAALVESHELDWGGLSRRAEELGGTRILLMGLSLANELLGVAPPEEILRRAKGDPVIASLTARVRDRIFRLDKPPGGDREEAALNTFYLSLRDGPLDKARYLTRAMTTPYRDDRALLPNLPARLWPLYYAAKPIRIIRERTAGSSVTPGAKP